MPISRPAPIDQQHRPLPQAPSTRPATPALNLTALLVLLALPATTLAEDILVTRKVADLYAVAGDTILLLTVDCDVYALAAQARLQPESGRMVLRFPSTTTATTSRQTSAANTGCDLRDMVTPQPVPRGHFHVRLSYESADWYTIVGTNLMLRTLGCERRTANEPVVWFQPVQGQGVIEYRSGLPCTSDGVFGSLRRQARSNAATAAPSPAAIATTR